MPWLSSLGTDQQLGGAIAWGWQLLATY